MHSAQTSITRGHRRHQTKPSAINSTTSTNGTQYTIEKKKSLELESFVGPIRRQRRQHFCAAMRAPGNAGAHTPHTYTMQLLLRLAGSFLFSSSRKNDQVSRAREENQFKTSLSRCAATLFRCRLHPSSREYCVEGIARCQRQAKQKNCIVARRGKEAKFQDASSRFFNCFGFSNELVSILRLFVWGIYSLNMRVIKMMI